MSKSGTFTPSPIGNPKCYIALLTQTGTNAPTATVLQNTLGGTPVWSYEGGGSYGVTLSGAWTANKTHVTCGSVYDSANSMTLAVAADMNASDTNMTIIRIYDPVSTGGIDSVLANTAIQILVYS